MTITKEELKELVTPSADIEKISSVSSDGENLLTRIPKDVARELKISKGDKLRWLVKVKSNEIILIIEDGRKKEKID